MMRLFAIEYVQVAYLLNIYLVYLYLNYLLKLRSTCIFQAYFWFNPCHSFFCSFLHCPAVTIIKCKSIVLATNYLNEFFESGFSNNVDTKLSSVSNYISLALDLEISLIEMHFSRCRFGAQKDALQAIFHNVGSGRVG